MGRESLKRERRKASPRRGFLGGSGASCSEGRRSQRKCVRGSSREACGSRARGAGDTWLGWSPSLLVRPSGGWSTFGFFPICCGLCRARSGSENFGRSAFYIAFFGAFSLGRVRFFPSLMVVKGRPVVFMGGNDLKVIAE